MLDKLTNLLRFDKELITTPNLNLGKKLSLASRKYLVVAANKRKIRYLDRDFYYDGRFSAVPLQMYPKEVDFLNKNINLKEIKSVLDIGANIGQFAFSLKSFFPNLEIFSFEPNKEISSILRKNLSYFSNVKIFEYGIGKNGSRTFYYSPSSSGLGSFYKENVNQFGKKEDLKEIKVEVVQLNKEKLKQLNIPAKFDLIKIDVEGAEIEVLESLKGTDCKYLFLEVSVNRDGKTDVENITKIIEKVFGKKAILLDSKRLFRDSPSMDCVFRLG